MEKDRKINVVIILLGIIVLALAVLLLLVISGKVSFKNDGNDNDINYDELAKISKGDYNFVNTDSDNSNSVNVLSNGKVFVNYDYYIENITNAKDIVLFSTPSDDSILYILTTDGNVYKYSLADAKNKMFEAAKIDKYSDIKQIFRYETRRSNAGGCSHVILVDKDGKYYSLDSYCV